MLPYSGKFSQTNFCESLEFLSEQNFCNFYFRELAAQITRQVYKFLRTEIFTDINFRKLNFVCKNCENLFLAKISRYTVCIAVRVHMYECIYIYMYMCL